MCFLHVYERISSPCRLKIDGLYTSGQESSEFDLASPATICDKKFQIHGDDQQDSHVVKISRFYSHIK